MTERIRSIKPEWLDDERMAEASNEARVLSIALILLADDHGNGRASAGVAGRVFPKSDNPRATFVDALEELSAIRYATTYDVDGQHYFSIRNWTKHQKIDHPSKPKVPGPDLATPVTTQDDSVMAGTAEVLDKDSGVLASTSVELRESSGLARAPAPQRARPIPSDPVCIPDPERVRAKSEARAKVAAKLKPNAKPIEFPEPYEPPAELVSALAIKHDATPEQVRRVVPDLAWYWRYGSGAGTKRALGGWHRTYANRVAALAKDGGLYTERPSGVQRTAGKPPGAIDHEAQQAELRPERRELRGGGELKPIDPQAAMAALQKVQGKHV